MSLFRQVCSARPLSRVCFKQNAGRLSLLSRSGAVRRHVYTTPTTTRAIPPTTLSSVGSPSHHFSPVSDPRPHILVIGSGWGGMSFLRHIDQRLHRVTVVSPRDYFVFTPFLAGASVGTHEIRSALEPIRRQSRGGLFFVKACVTSIDLEKKFVCVKTVDEVRHSSGTFINQGEDVEKHLSYDKLLITCGSAVQTYNTPGVVDHARILKDIKDAEAVREQIMTLFERACLPETTQQQRKQLLHFVVVGGGPTSVEFIGELYDLITEDLSKTFHHEVINHVSITLLDVAPEILAPFHPDLRKFVMNQLENKIKVKVRTSMSIKEIGETKITLANGEVMPYGLVLWSPGVGPTSLTRSIETTVLSKDRTGRIFTCPHLRVLKPNGDEDGYEVYEDVFALGDCATVITRDLPATAQVATQKAVWLAKTLNKAQKNKAKVQELQKFEYKDRGYMAYVGGWNGVAGITSPISSDKKILLKGKSGAAFWRCVYVSMTMSWRNRILVPIFWLLTWCFGREISLIKRYFKP